MGSSTTGSLTCSSSTEILGSQLHVFVPPLRNRTRRHFVSSQLVVGWIWVEGSMIVASTFPPKAKGHMKLGEPEYTAYEEEYEGGI